MGHVDQFSMRMNKDVYREARSPSLNVVPRVRNNIESLNASEVSHVL